MEFWKQVRTYHHLIRWFIYGTNAVLFMVLMLTGFSFLMYMAFKATLFIILVIPPIMWIGILLLLAIMVLGAIFDSDKIRELWD